jgi:hypothetical protein
VTEVTIILYDENLLKRLIEKSLKNVFYPWIDKFKLPYFPHYHPHRRMTRNPFNPYLNPHKTRTADRNNILVDEEELKGKNLSAISYFPGKRS